MRHRIEQGDAPGRQLQREHCFRDGRQVDGFAYCEAVTSVRTDTDSCMSIFPGRTYRIAIVDQGSTKPPTLLWESSTTDFTANATNSGAEIAKEFAAWRATVRFG